MDPQPLKIGVPFVEFPAGGYNALVADYKARRANTPPQTARGPTARVLVLCHNSTSTNLEPGEILGFSEPIFSLDDRGDQVYSAPNVKGITPAVPTHSSQFVVATQYIQGTGDVSGGAIGPAVLVGLAWAKVNWTDEAHTRVKVAEGETKLQSSASGITPIWHEEIPDPEYLPAELWALILLGGGGGGGGSARWGRLVAPIVGGAAGPLAADWATADVLFQDDTTGELDTEPTSCTFKWIGESVSADAQVKVVNGIIEDWLCDAVIDWGDEES